MGSEGEVTGEVKSISDSSWNPKEEQKACVISRDEHRGP